MINNINTYSNINLIKAYQQRQQQNKKPQQPVQQQTKPITTTNEPQKQPDLKPTKTSIFYVNDVHGKMTNMERIYAIAKEFDNSKEKNTDKLKLASGDIILGANYTSNQVANRFLNWIGVSANALGNHELDVVPKNLASLMDNAKYKLLAINASVDASSPMAGKIGKSIIEERNGQKYGIIGIAPSDMAERVKLNDSVKDIKIDDFPTTIKKVQEEVDRLKGEGINKIIVLSHSGFKHDKKMAQETSGIDVILGAHTHDLITGIKEGENLFYSKTGEPVVITQAGKDGENVGILNLEFTPAGVISKVQNNVIKTRSYSRNLSSRSAVESIIGKPEVLGKVTSTVAPPKERLIENNPHGNIIADAMRSELGTDIAILNAGNIRGHFDLGPVDSRLINDITPFEDKMLIGKLSEKEIVDAIKVGGQSFVRTGHKPGILLVSGLKYTMTDKGELKALSYIDKAGKEIAIDINNPGTERKYTVAMDDFFATGGDNYLPTNENPDFIIKKFNLDKNKLACDYIKKMQGTFEVKNDDRVKIINHETPTNAT